MNATDQATAAEAMEATGYHWYRCVSDGGGNITRLDRIPWATALVLITRGECKRWVLARDVEDTDRAQLSLVRDDDGMYLAEHAEAGARRIDDSPTRGNDR